MRRLVYLVAVSADGFIADAQGSYAAFPQDPTTLADLFAEYPETCPVQAREALGVTGPARRFDTVLLGRRTHQPALDAGLTSAYPHLVQYVATHRDDLPPDPTITVTTDPLGLVRELKRGTGLDIWLCGGGDLAGQLVDEIDEFHLKVYPVLFGEGVPLVAGRHQPLDLHLGSSQPLGDAGVLLLRYVRCDAPRARHP